MLNLLIVIVVPYAFLCALLYAMPALLSPRNQFFSVSVDPGFRQSRQAQHILHAYHLQVLLHTGLGLCGIAFLTSRGPLGWVLLPFLWPTIGSSIAVFVAHRAALAFAKPPSGIREVSLQPRPRSLPGGLLACAGPFLILFLAATYLAARWSEIPHRFPIHWGLDGVPNGWASRTLRGVFGQLLLMAAVCLLNLGIVWIIARQSRGTPESRAANIRIVHVISHGLAALAAWISIQCALGHGPPNQIAMIAVVIGFLVICVAVARRTLFNGKDTDDPSPDSSWGGGLIYFNPNDPALIVEKRMGIGYTMNMARPAAWILLGVILLIPALLLLLTAHA